MGGGEGGNRGSLPQAPQCKGAPKQCRTCSNKMRSSVTFQSSFVKGLVSLYFQLKSTCSFASHFMLLTLRSPLARAPYCVHARKRASGAPRTHFRACKISKISWGVPQTPPHTIYFVGPTFCIYPGPPQSSRQPYLQVSYFSP